MKKIFKVNRFFVKGYEIFRVIIPAEIVKNLKITKNDYVVWEVNEKERSANLKFFNFEQMNSE